MDADWGVEAGVRPQRKLNRTNRIRAACVRCQRRKIKCDGSTPACSSCKKAGAVCVDTARQREYPKAYIASLQERIRWLESTLSTRCPDVDLHEGPRILLETTPHQSGLEQEQSPQGSPEIGAISLGVPSRNTIPRDLVGDLAPCETREEASLPSEDAPPERLAHQIGLVSVSGGQDLRYVGPSSGYFFAKLVLACAGKQGRNRLSSQSYSLQPISDARESFRAPPAALPQSLEHAVELSAAYWEVVHSHYPFLHRPSYVKLLEHMYTSDSPSSIAAFQVNMVLAISATILSRRFKMPLSAEGFCTTALTHFERISIEGSLEGLQCLLLLQMYAMNNPSMGLNVWYLNYQCIAAVLDLGLQRDVRAGNSVSILTQEIRTRIFWVVYSLDRTLATIMGRPIGLRDEACELRLPQDKEDDHLSDPSIRPRLECAPPTATTIAIHLIKLAKLTSEIKYVANSISHKTPAYTYPQIPDILQWQKDVIERLQQWSARIPQFDGPQRYLTNSCQIKYHEVMMLLLRPSPAIANPSQTSLELCHQSAIAVIRIFDDLYRGDLLVYSWVTVHSVFMSTITMLYCIWVIPGVAKATKLDILIADLKKGSNVLSATAEHWTEAKRSREVLDELSSATIRWIMDTQALQSQTTIKPVGMIPGSNSLRDQAVTQPAASSSRHDLASQTIAHAEIEPFLSFPALDEYLNLDTFASFLGEQNQIDFSSADALDINTIMQGVFSDYQTPVDFGADFVP